MIFQQYPECTGEELTNNLLQQIKPFNVKFHLNERVEQLKKVENRWHVKTSGNQEFDVASIVIAGGVGSFEPRKFPLKECEKFEGSSLFYSIKDKSIFKEKTISIFGGGDSALDWAIELSNTSKVNLIHRRDGFSGAESSVQKVKELSDQGKLNLYTKYQIDSVSGDKNIN
jgi:thioredoxin reductase (NADPH)